MGKKIDKTKAVPAVVEDESEAIKTKKNNAKKLAQTLKTVTAEVLAKVDAKQVLKAVQAVQKFQKTKAA